MLCNNKKKAPVSDEEARSQYMFIQRDQKKKIMMSVCYVINSLIVYDICV